MIKNTLILLTMATGLCYAGECKLKPDVCAWNDAMAAVKEYATAETEFSTKAQEFRAARQAEEDEPGTISSDVVKKSTAMWVAWQQFLAAQKKMQKAMHDFFVVEMNR